MRRKQEPAPRADTHGEIDLGDVQVTIDVLSEPVRPHSGALRRRNAFAVLSLVAIVSVGAILAVPGRDRSRLASAAARARLPANSEGVATRFGIRSHCVRRAIISRDGSFARVDFDRSDECGAAGNHVTLILRRVRHAWVAAFDATGWRCPAGTLPRPVLRELRLCRGRSPARSG